MAKSQRAEAMALGQEVGRAARVPEAHSLHKPLLPEGSQSESASQTESSATLTPCIGTDPHATSAGHPHEHEQDEFTPEPISPQHVDAAREHEIFHTPPLGPVQQPTCTGPLQQLPTLVRVWSIVELLHETKQPRRAGSLPGVGMRRRRAKPLKPLKATSVSFWGLFSQADAVEVVLHAAGQPGRSGAGGCACPDLPFCQLSGWTWQPVRSILHGAPGGCACGSARSRTTSTRVTSTVLHGPGSVTSSTVLQHCAALSLPGASTCRVWRHHICQILGATLGKQVAEQLSPKCPALIPCSVY